MTCPCEDKCAGKLPPKAIEIVKECGPVLFHKVPYPASLGVPTDEELRALQYKNVLLEVEANKHVYLYSSDGVPTLISKGDIDPTEILEAISELQQSLAAETSAREEADVALRALNEQTTTVVNDLAGEISALQNTSVVKDVSVSGDTSTVTVTKTTGELSADGTETAMPLPVASAEQAGVMNASTFSAVQENSENIDSILGGAITLSTIPADPTQEQLTDAWKTATGKTELVNRASIYDETNKLVWYYYSNASEWKSMPAGDAAVSVSIATNDTAGIVKGSTEDGQVAVEADGSMSLNGYDTLNSSVENLSEKVDGIEVPKPPLYVIGSNFESAASVGVMAEYNAPTKPNQILRQFMYNTTTGESQQRTTTLLPVTTQYNGLMTPAAKQKLDSLLPIQSLGEGLELSDDGVLTVVGGGSGADLPALVFGQPKGVSWFSTSISPTAMSLKGPMYDTTTSTQLEQEQYWTLTNVSYNGAGLMTSYDKIRFDSLADIKTIGSGLSLSDEGELTANGGGGSDVNLLTAYTATVGGNDVYDARYLNGRLDGTATIGLHLGQGSTALFYGVALGAGAQASQEQSVALGFSSRTTREKEVSIGYSTTSTRFLANVTAGELPTDAVNLQQMQDYVAEHAGGGGSATLYSEYGTNTDGALTQAFVSGVLNSANVVLGEGASSSRPEDVVAIGQYVIANGLESTAIGGGATTVAQQSIAIGYGAETASSNTKSVALGNSSKTSRALEVSIGAGTGSTSTRFLANVTAGALDTDATNLAQVRSATVGEVLYSGTDAEATITLTSPVSQYEKVEIIGSWTMPHTDTTTPLQVIGHWHLNDQDNSRTFQLRAVDVDPTANQKTEVVETWSFTGSTTLQMVSGAQISGELTEQVMEALETPQIIVTKVVGIKAI